MNLFSDRHQNDVYVLYSKGHYYFKNILLNLVFPEVYPVTLCSLSQLSVSAVSALHKNGSRGRDFLSINCALIGQYALFWFSVGEAMGSLCSLIGCS